MLINDLPDCMLEQILEYLTYDEIAKMRLVSVRFNKIGQGLLNLGFNKMMRRHTLNLKRIKAQLPRRESERRNHALAKHADILTCIETRISMLSMTYTKYVDLNLCCFIPGKIIDEVMQILTLVNSTQKPLRAHEVLQELRDISSMAIDHFDDKIAPMLKKSFCDLSSQKLNSSIYQLVQSAAILDTSPPSVADYGNVDIVGVAHHSPPTEARGAQRLAMYRLDQKCDSIMKKLKCIISMQRQQSRHIRNNSMQISELKTEMLEFRRRMENTAPKQHSPIAGPSTSAAAAAAAAAAASVATSSSHLLPSTSSATARPLTPLPLVERSHASSSSDSIEVLSRSSASTPHSSTVSPGTCSSSGSPPGQQQPASSSCPSSNSDQQPATAADRAFSNNIKPRTATIVLKRRHETGAASGGAITPNQMNAKMMRFDMADSDSD